MKRSEIKLQLAKLIEEYGIGGKYSNDSFEENAEHLLNFLEQSGMLSKESPDKLKLMQDHLGKLGFTVKEVDWKKDDETEVKKGIEYPFEKDEDARSLITVEMLIKMLQKVPKDYIVKYDSAFGSIMKGDFTVYHDRKEISINGD